MFDVKVRSKVPVSSRPKLLGSNNSTLGKNEVVVYNFQCAPSNAYYKKLGATVMRVDTQLEEKLPVDVFRCALTTMKEQVDLRLKKLR